MKFLLDTHVWISWHANPEALAPRIRKLIEDAKYDELLLSAISIWEFSKLVSKGRLAVYCDGKDWINEALIMPRLRLVPLSPEIAWQSTQLPQPFHDDPADQIIVATARSENAVLLTSDAQIKRYPHVRTES